MGIYNRDYMRDGGQSGRMWSGGSSNLPPVCKWLIIITAAVFILQILAGPALQSWLVLDGGSILKGQVWRLVTYAFCHDPGDLLHILFNMLFLWWFGKTLEQMYGSLEFLLFYLVGAIVAGLAFLGLNVATGDVFSVALGASGSVMAVMMLYAALFPRQKIYIWMIIPVEIRWLVLAYVIFDLLPVIRALSGNAISDGIAHAAHLGGLLFGFIYWKFGLNLSRYWLAVTAPASIRKASKKRPKSGRKIIQMPGTRPATTEGKQEQPTAALEKEVDRILQKIGDQGNTSLTDKERQTLVEASERIKKRDN
ncbi:MAG: membrane associated rhomboid family serine protease [Verrucomicrobiales bacterium]|jgi:membrane associated rhomboid family serine protease